MIGLALAIIAHQPMRFIAALLGVAASAGLAFVQLGLYYGFKQNASIVVDHTGGDIWVCSQFQENFDFPKLLRPGTLEFVRSTRGVSTASPMLIVFSKWRLQSGAEKTVQVVGYDVSSKVGEPWRMLRGFPGDLDQPGAVTVDTVSQGRLDGVDIGAPCEIGQVAGQVFGVTDGIRSFQGNPVVFTDIVNARSFGRLRSDAIHYIIVKAEKNTDQEELLRALSSIPHCEAYSKAAFSKKAQDYWLNSTGAGIALAISAMMGLAVGVVVAGQVLYSSTLEHIREYGTLKAMGASNTQVGTAIVAQALAGALPAHLLAGGLLLIAGKFIGGKGIHLSLGWDQYCMLGLFTAGVCVAASLLSVYKVMSVEPAEVFRG